MNDFKEDNLAILLLAAGSASRMGRPKQLLPWKDKTLMEHAIDIALDITQNVFVVLGANHDAIKKRIDQRRIKIIENKAWEEGMGTSISKGTMHIQENEEIKAILVMLVDQPLLKKEHFMSLIDNLKKTAATIICTNYEGRSGVPAIFDASHFSQLGQLNQDFGAKHVIKENKQTLSIQPLGNTVDIDTIDMYNELYEHYGQPN